MAGYSDRNIQKMGCWRGETFKEYIREELHCFLDIMLTSTKQNFKFVNIAGVVYSKLVDGTSMAVKKNYQPSATAAKVIDQLYGRMMLLRVADRSMKLKNLGK